MWPRNKYTGPDGGAYTGPGGGMYDGPGKPYMSNIPPWDIFIKKLEELGYNIQAEMIKRVYYK